jgi:hypothetical protein
MHCELTQPEIVSFYFGDVEEKARARVETHLRECRPCLDAYLSLKRSIEAADLKPSEEARIRLRNAVARELSAAQPAANSLAGAFGPLGPAFAPAMPVLTPPTVWLWWERPLAVAFAMAALALATLVVSRL